MGQGMSGAETVSAQLLACSCSRLPGRQNASKILYGIKFLYIKFSMEYFSTGLTKFDLLGQNHK
jgi:hypothetical protein